MGRTVGNPAFGAGGKGIDAREASSTGECRVLAFTGDVSGPDISELAWCPGRWDVSAGEFPDA